MSNLKQHRIEEIIHILKANKNKNLKEEAKNKAEAVAKQDLNKKLNLPPKLWNKVIISIKPKVEFLLQFVPLFIWVAKCI